MPSAAAERDYYIDMLQEQGYVDVAYSLGPSDVEPVFDALRLVLDEFDGLPSDDHRRVWVSAFANGVDGREHDSKGFLVKRRIGEVNIHEEGRAPATENKDLLHFTPRTADRAAAVFGVHGGMPASVARLISLCTNIYETARSDMRPAFSALGLDKVILAPEARDNIHLLRVMRYLGSTAIPEASATRFKSHDELAELHFDRSKMTAAIWESSSGLVGAPGNNYVGEPDLSVETFDGYADAARRSRIAHKAHRIKVFAGAGYNHLDEETRERSGNLRPLLHGVVDDNPGEERDAVVLFMNERIGLDYGFADSKQTGFGDTRTELEKRIIRHGGLAASA